MPVSVSKTTTPSASHGFAANSIADDLCVCVCVCVINTTEVLFLLSLVWDIEDKESVKIENWFLTCWGSVHTQVQAGNELIKTMQVDTNWNNTTHMKYTQKSIEIEHNLMYKVKMLKTKVLHVFWNRLA